jgi:hypothetical protein
MLRRSRSLSDSSDGDGDGDSTPPLLRTQMSPQMRYQRTTTTSTTTTSNNSSTTNLPQSHPIPIARQPPVTSGPGLGYNTPLSSTASAGLSASPFSLNFRSNHRVHDHQLNQQQHLHQDESYEANSFNSYTRNREKEDDDYDHDYDHDSSTPLHQPSLSRSNHVDRFVSCCASMCLTLLSFVVIFIFVAFIWTRELRMAPNECIEFPENPLYTEIPFVGIDSTSPPYRLVHVHPLGRPGDLGRSLTYDEIWNQGAPVLFIPGHAGSYNQTKASAAQAAAEAKSLHGGTKLNFFAVDTLEVPSGLAAELLWSQADFINRCIHTILDNYSKKKKRRGGGGGGGESGAKYNRHYVTPTSVVILAHSMGGMAARAAPLVENYRRGTIGAIVTLNTPHRAHPYGGDGYLEEFYAHVNGVWSNHNSWEDGGALENIVIASIAGGSRDHVVRGDLTSLDGLSPQGRSVHAWSTSLPGVWIQMDHDSIVWCGQLIAVLSRAVMSLHQSTQRGMILQPLERLEAFDNALHGGRAKRNRLFESVPHDASKSYRKRSAIVPQAYSHAFVGSRSTSRSGEKVHTIKMGKHGEVGSNGVRSTGSAEDLSRGLCIPLPNTMSLSAESLVFVTDVAPIRSVIVSSCTESCTRGGRTSAHGWLDGRKQKGCLVLDDGIKVDVMPHSKRRHHLHHSYDPLMHFGRERHHHRWSRVTSSDLIDEAKYR